MLSIILDSIMSLVLVGFVSSFAALLAPPVLLAFALRAFAAPHVSHDRPCRRVDRPLMAAPPALRGQNA